MVTRNLIETCLDGLRSDVGKLPEERDLNDLHNEHVGERDLQLYIAGSYEM